MREREFPAERRLNSDVSSPSPVGRFRAGLSITFKELLSCASSDPAW